MKYKVTYTYTINGITKKVVREYAKKTEMRKKIKIFLDHYKKDCYYWIDEIGKKEVRKRNEESFL